MKIAVLGGGLSGISLAFFLQEKVEANEIVIFEQEKKAGGLCRSFEQNGIYYDIGPHIIFSKDQEILDLMKESLKDNCQEIRRSNRIIHDKRLIQYPFENDLSKLSNEDRRFCLNSFINNPYENYPADNMLQFFLKMFGEGITNLYLRPYNEKIWKFDPAYMDTGMVERIPIPSKDDIVRSASGETVDGYIHQLYFSYPKNNGIESLIQVFLKRFTPKVNILLNNKVQEIFHEGSQWVINTNHECLKFDRIVSTIPLNRLCNIYFPKDNNVINSAQKLKYNSLIVGLINTKVDRSLENFAFMNADKNVIFHRVSKLDFLGESYHLEDSVSYLVEITYSQGDKIDSTTDEMLYEKIIEGLQQIGFINSVIEINFTCMSRFEYAYVIYDIEYRKNCEIIKKYFQNEGVILNGRFGEFEYLNMDQIIRRSKDLAEVIC